MLSKKHRVLSNKEISYIYRKGIKVGSIYGSMIGIAQPKNTCSNIQSAPLTCIRFGFVVSKKVGKATKRNKIKRQLRAIAKLIIDEKMMQEDKGTLMKILYVVNPGQEYDYQEMKKTFLTQFESLQNILKNNITKNA